MKVYKGFVADSTRWEAFTFRPGDIVISTPSKCGTTWMQRLVALLVFDGPDLPAPMADVSPWLDMNTRPIHAVIADLDAQTHRRFIKTHTPLDGLPISDEVTYICVGRDPRDAAVSMAHHMNNMEIEQLITLRAEAVGLDDVPPDAEVPDRSLDDLPGKLRRWIDAPAGNTDGMESLATILHHFDTFFAERRRPNAHLFHYSDLRADLPGQLHRLADALGVELITERAVELAAEGSIEAMRARAVDFAPNATQSLWKDTARFFRSGTGGEWQELMTAADQRHYAERVTELTSPEVARWAHAGR
jgi:hypothetical protein